MQLRFEDITSDVKLEVYGIKKPEIESDRDRVYNAILENGSLTCKELADTWHVPSHCISGRFTELARDGFIVPDGKRYLPNHKGQMYPYTVWSVKI